MFKLLKNWAMLLFASALFCVCSFAHAQDIGLKVSNNATSNPFTGVPQLFMSKFHPSVDLLYRNDFAQKGNRTLAWEGNLGYMYHRFLQSAIKVNATFLYNKHVKPHTDFYAGLGGGYWHAITQYDVFKMNGDGVYEKVSGVKGRPNFSAHLALGITKDVFQNKVGDWKMLIEYRAIVHGVFANSYVPVVPYNSLSVGLRCNISNFKKETK